MKKRAIALVLCTVMLLTGLPVTPVLPDMSVTAAAVDIESLQSLYNSIPEKETWDSLYINTKTLDAWYTQAQTVLSSPDSFSQSNIDLVETSLRTAYESLEYHTQSISVSPTSVTLNVGATYSLKPVLSPENAADDVVWTSDNEAVVSVSSTGVATVHKYSSSTVTVTATSNGHSASCKIKTLNPLAGVKLTAPSSLYEGQGQTLKAEVVGKDSSAATTDDYILTWDSSNTAVATVSDSGLLTAKTKGTTVITVTAKSSSGSFSSSATVTVNELIEITALKVLTTTTAGVLTMNIGDTTDFKVSITPTDASIKNLTWQSSDTSILTVTDNGYSGATASATLKALKSGKVKLTYSAKDGSGISGYVTVDVRPLISSITLTETRKVISPSATTAKITVKILPENAGNQTLSFTSSNPDVCDVKYDGTLTPKSLGTCTIYVKTTDGSNLSASCYVRVASLATAVSLDKTTATVNTGKTVKLTAAVSTVNGSYSDVEWTSENMSVATVDSNGTVTGIYPGTAIIRARALDGTEKSAVCIVTVKQPVEGVSITSSKTIGVDKTFTLTAQFTPTYASNKNVTWKSSNTSVATVSDSGVVTGKKVGTCTVTCTTEDGGYTASCTVTVIIPTTGVTLSKTTASVNKDATTTITATVAPSNATNKTVTWKSSNTAVATVSASGVVTGVAGGTCTITCTTSGGQTATCTVTVIEKATGVSISKTSLSVYTGQNSTLTANVLPTTATNRSVTWSTSNSKIATVNSSGVVTGIAKGVAVITVTTADGGYTATCTVTVTQKVDVTGIKLNATSISLDAGELYYFDATISPTNASDKSITWSSNNKTVATVTSQGVVTAVSSGSAVISATTKDGGYVAKCTVKVTTSVSGVRLSTSEVRIAKGQSKTLIANIFPTDATTQTVKWSSSNTKVVTVSSKGVVTAVAAGVATVTVTTVDGGFTASCNFTVYTPVSGVKVSSTTATVAKGETILLTAKVSPTTATDSSVRWSSSDSGVATVNTAGQVTGKKVGSAVITVTTVDGNFRSSCTVTVVQLATGVTLDYSSLTLYAGKTKTLTAKLKPSTVSNTTIKWSSSNTKVATVNSKGKITAVAGGTATIKATSGDGKAYATCKLTVYQNPTSVTLSQKTMGVWVGSSKVLTAKVLPTTATNRSVKWTSSNTKVATVDSAGLVKGISKGTATITATTASGAITATCKVNVVKHVTGVSLNKTSLTLTNGKQSTLTATVKPSDAYIKTVTWSSSNNDVATVNSKGVVTAKSPGYAEITVKTKDGSYKAVCKVLVVQPVTSIKLDSSTKYVEVGGISKITATIKPSNATNKTIKWTSSNSSVAKVSSSGVVTGVKKGTATITATTVSGSKVATCKVNVVIKVKSITLNKSDMVLYINQSSTLKAYVAPSDATVKTVKWTTSNKDVLKVDSNGKLTPVKPGKATITATTVDGGLKAKCTVSVEIPATSLKLSKTSVSINSGTNYKLTATISPSNTTNKTVTWKSSNEAIATVSSNGTVTGIGGGKATITATTSNGLKKTCVVTVIKSVSSVSLDKSAVSLFTGTSTKLVASVLPADASNKAITWSSSNSAVASVDANGTVKAYKSGTAVITVKTADKGYTAKCTVTVLQHATSVTLNNATLSVAKGGTAKLTATVLPADAYDKTVTWVSSAPEIVSVSSDGTLTALKTGTASITVTTKDMSKKAVCTVNVYEPVTGVSINNQPTTIYVGDKLSFSCTVSPSDATTKTVKWSSTEAAILSIDSNGVATALKSGKALIKVTTVDGSFTDTCEITVLQKATGIVLDKSAVSVNRDASVALTATVMPLDCYNKEVVWSSEDDTVATVENGVVNGLKVGETVITVTSVDGDFKANCAVTVTEPVTGITADKESITIYTHQSEKITAEALPSIATNKNIIWSSDDESVATVKDGEVLGVGGGTAVITAKTEDGGFTATCEVTVRISAESIEIPETSLQIARGDSKQLDVTVLPTNTYDKTVKFASSDSSIASVDENGLLTANKVGNVEITVSAVIGSAKTVIKVEVFEPASEVIVSKNVPALWVGQKAELTVKVLPEETTYKQVTWSSSDESVATVKDGVVTAVAPGTAKITAVSYCKKASDSITVTVRQPVSQITLDKTDVKLSVGGTATVTAAVLPANAYSIAVKWESDNEAVATVDKNGVITAVGKGKTVITAVSVDGFVTATCVVTVN